MVSNRSDGKYVSYGEMPQLSGTNGSAGTFVYFPGSRWFPVPYLYGTLSQFFSDRRFDVSEGLVTTSDPFSPQSVDSLGVVIYLEGWDTGSPTTTITPGEVVFTLNSWGGAQSAFRGQCSDGMITGFIGNTGYILSLFNQSVTPPPPPTQ